MDWKEPLTGNASDVLAAERALQFKLGWFAHPIYIDGDYPEVMKQRVAAKSLAEGRNESRLPQFTDEEKAFIRGDDRCSFKDCSSLLELVQHPSAHLVI